MGLDIVVVAAAALLMLLLGLMISSDEFLLVMLMFVKGVVMYAIVKVVAIDVVFVCVGFAIVFYFCYVCTEVLDNSLVITKLFNDYNILFEVYEG